MLRNTKLLLTCMLLRVIFRTAAAQQPQEGNRDEIQHVCCRGVQIRLRTPFGFLASQLFFFAFLFSLLPTGIVLRKIPFLFRG